MSEIYNRRGVFKSSYDGKQLIAGILVIDLDPEQARDVRKAIEDWEIDEHSNWMAHQYETGNFWRVTYMRHGNEVVEIEYSLEDALRLLKIGEEMDSLSYVSARIQCPDGTTLEGVKLYNAIEGKS
jgi:hypothetical protein